jgi:hypothetical protein
MGTSQKRVVTEFTTNFFMWQEAYRPESKFGLFHIDRNTRDGHPDPANRRKTC